MKEVIAIGLLCIPTAWELWDDRDGDPNKKLDVFVRCILVAGSAVYPWYIGHGYWASVFMAGGIFTMVFDYLENKINLKRKDWFSFLGTTSEQDKIKWWRNMKPKYRFGLRLGVFLITLFFYIRY